MLNKMTNSQFCIQQRKQEQRRLNKLLIAGFVGSATVHGILAYALPRLSFDPPQQAEEPIEMVLVDKPKPTPKPEPKIESKPIVEPEPKSVQSSEPVKAQTSPPPVKPPEPVQAQTAPPKPAPELEPQAAPPEPVPEPAPAPKEAVTNSTLAPSQPIVSAPIENTGQSSILSSNFGASSSSVATSSSGSGSGSVGKPGGSGSGVATNSSAVGTGSAPPRPGTGSGSGGEEGISCLSNCEPEYPATLEGTEGSAGVKLTVNPDGNVIGAELVEPHSDSGVNRQALLAARQMQFSSPSSNSAAVRINIDFTVEGSQYDRAARQEQERREQAARESQEQEAARQQQLEQEQQARQEQLERERQARQEQLQQQQESAPPPAQTDVVEPKPLPALSPEKLDEERLRKFKERMEQYQEE